MIRATSIRCALVMAGQRVELARDQQAFEADGAMPADLGREVRLKTGTTPARSMIPQRQLQIVAAGGPAT